MLGSAIGMKVMEDVPYIKGLDRWLGRELTPGTQDYLKDMGAASASNGAVGLYTWTASRPRPSNKANTS